MTKTITQKKVRTRTNVDAAKSNEKTSLSENEPSAFCISNILNYSKALRISESKCMKHFEMLLN